MKRALLNSARWPDNIQRSIGACVYTGADGRGVTVSGLPPQTEWTSLTLREGEFIEPFPYIRLADMGGKAVTSHILRQYPCKVL